MTGWATVSASSLTRPTPAYDRRSHFAHQPRERIVVEGLRRAVHRVWAADVMDRCRRQTRFDQLDSPTIHDLVLSRGGHAHRPAEVVHEAETHTVDCASDGLWHPRSDQCLE